MMTEREIFEILDRISYKNWKIKVCWVQDRPYLQVHWKGPCALTGAVCDQSGRKWFLSKHMVKSELVGTAFKAVVTVEEHGVREHFKYEGHSIYNPHYDVEALLGLCIDGKFEVRET